MFDLALVIGRFQPFHAGHAALLTQALGKADRVLVILGSHDRPRSPRNPWASHEREALIRLWLPSEDQSRVVFHPVADHLYEEAWWRESIRQAVRIQTRTGAQVTLVAYAQDDTRPYLAAFPEWPTLGCDLIPGATGTAFRLSYFAQEGKGLWQAMVPKATLPWLEAFRDTEAFAWLKDEHQAIQDYRAKWAPAPYAPTLVTVDVLATAREQVLLVRRGKAPGRGLLALPGGFLDGKERLAEAALRELKEETCLAMPSTQGNNLCPAGVFDHPDRSERGRMIGHVYRLDLGDMSPPRVDGGDDAAESFWMPISEAVSKPECFFDDHHEILCLFTSPRTREVPCSPTTSPLI
jgi:bifunctional NMN adenylyltransferase/nudix hydrolase